MAHYRDFEGDVYMGIAYYDGLLEEPVSMERAQRIVREHSADWATFVAECGAADVYALHIIGGWLGY